MSDGNAQTDGNTQGVSAPTVMSHVGGGVEPTSPVLQAPPGDVANIMQIGEIAVEHHPVRVFPQGEPQQDFAGARDNGAQ